MKKVGGWLYGCALAASPIKAWLGATFAGISMVLLSGMLGLNDHFGKPKVGYFDALNWSFGFTVLFPAALLGTLSAISAMEPLIVDLEARRMLVDAAWKPVSAEPFLQSWRQRVTSYAMWTALAALAAIGWCAWEWWTSSGVHLWRGTLPSEVPPDWTVATVAQHRALMARIGNGVFTFGALVGLQGLLAVCALGLLCFAAAVTDFVLAHTLPPRPGQSAVLRLVPTVTESSDPRCGFQAFEGVLLMVLLAVSALFVMAYGSVVWNAFLPSSSQTMLDFARHDMLAGLGNDVAATFGSVTSSIDAAAASSVQYASERFTDAAPISAYALLATVICAIPIVLRFGAMRSRDAVLVLVEGNRIPAGAWIEDQDLEAVRARLTAMEFWPMRYVSLTHLLVAVGFGSICVVWYRFGIVYLGLVVSLLVTHVWAATKAKGAAGKPGPKTGAAAPPA